MASSTIWPSDLLAICAGHDAGPGDAIDGVRARWVAEPASIEEASRLLALAHGSGLAVAPRGGGTKMGLGNPPSALDVILSTARLNRVLEHAAGDLVARLEAGVRLDEAQDVFRQAGQWLPIDPPEPGATIGGIVAANASGPHRLRYGTMRDLVIGITYVLADGTIARTGGKVVKNVAGYDLGKLFTGSLGTLALLAEVIVRLHPLPKVRRAVGLRGRIEPAAIQAMLNSSMVPVALRYLHEPNKSELVAMFAGVEAGVTAQVEQALTLWAPFGEVESYDQEGVVRCGQMLPVVDTAANVELVSLKLSGRLTDFQRMLTAVQSTLSAHSLYRVAAEVGTGVMTVEVHGDSMIIGDDIIRLRTRLAGTGIHTVVWSASPVVKAITGDVWGDSGSSLALMRRLKDTFDPGAVLNPGRYIGRI